MSKPRGRTGRKLWWLLAAMLLLVGAGCLVGAATQPGPGNSPAEAVVSAGRPPREATISATRPQGSQDAIRPQPAIARSVPDWLTIPSIHVSSAVVPLGLNGDGTVQVPGNPQKPGWYRFGPSPGERGSAVILGHVDSYQGPGIFYLLSALRPGDTLGVKLSDGRSAHFVVTAVATYSNASFPKAEVYGPHGYSGLQLVTCGDGFDTRTEEYLGNVVVYTKLTSLSPISLTNPGDAPVRATTPTAR